MAVLATLPRRGAYVVPADNPNKPRADRTGHGEQLSKRADLNGVRIHDLRHTHASVGAGAGLGLPIIGKLLVYTQAGRSSDMPISTQTLSARLLRLSASQSPLLWEKHLSLLQFAHPLEVTTSPLRGSRGQLSVGSGH